MTPTPAGELTARTTVRISESIYARAFGAELVLLDFSRGEYFGLDELGAQIWRKLEIGATLGAIADDIVTTYDAKRDDVLRDLVDLVKQLLDQGLVVADSHDSL